MKAKKDCIFCQIASGKLACEMVFENERIIAFKDVNPKAAVHILVIPKEHIVNLSQAEDRHRELLGEIQLVLRDLAKKFKIEDGFKVNLNNGKKAGQIVFHLHYHLLGGF